MSGVIKLDRIRNERIRGTSPDNEGWRNIQESRLKWYGHVLRREDVYVDKRVMGMEVPGNRRGRPKRRWLDSIRNNLSEDAQDQAKWRHLIRHMYRPHIKVGKNEVKKKKKFIQSFHISTCKKIAYSILMQNIDFQSTFKRKMPEII